MELQMNLKTTPLHSQNEKLGAKFAPFGGWDMPISYSGIIDEHSWTRKSACLFDICRCKIDQTLGVGVCKAGIDDRTSDTLNALFDSRVGQPDDHRLVKTAACNVNFDLADDTINTFKRNTI